MTKAELIEAISKYPDDTPIQVWCGHDCRDPGGTYNIINIRDDVIKGRITFEMDDD